MSWWIGQARWQGETGTLRLRSLRPTNTLFEAVSVVVFPISVRTALTLTMPTVLEVFLKSGPSSSVMRTTGVSSRYMMSAPDSRESAIFRPGSGRRMYASTRPLPSANAAIASR